MTGTLKVKDGGTGINEVVQSSSNIVQSISAVNCPPANDTPGLAMFGVFMGVLCILYFTGLLITSDI